MRIETGTLSDMPLAQQSDRSDSARVPQNFIADIVIAADAF